MVESLLAYASRTLTDMVLHYMAFADMLLIHSILLWLMNSLSQVKNTPIVRKNNFGLKLKLIISSVDFRVLTRRKSVASY